MRTLIVLYADDNSASRQLVRLMLRDQDCRFIEAVDGQTAIDVSLAEHPDLIFMDISMPFVNGLEATAHLKSLPETSHIQIYALTSATMPGDREACLAAGCDGYLVKPIVRQELLHAIARTKDYIRQVGGTGPLGQTGALRASGSLG